MLPEVEEITDVAVIGTTSNGLLEKNALDSSRGNPALSTKMINQIQSTPVVEEQILASEGALDPPAEPYRLQYTDPPAAHLKVKDWILFSDLHVKSASIDVCEQVLREVHTAAVQRQAGIIFLGDFWHVRGALNVDLLNRILICLSAWTQPVVMIPGNHDQVTLGGTIHALEPLRYAFSSSDQILMISEPTVCMGALWIPYRRDHALLRRILYAGSQDPSVGIIFCHTDGIYFVCLHCHYSDFISSACSEGRVYERWNEVSGGDGFTELPTPYSHIQWPLP